MFHIHAFKEYLNLCSTPHTHTNKTYFSYLTGVRVLVGYMKFFYQYLVITCI